MRNNIKKIILPLGIFSIFLPAWYLRTFTNFTVVEILPVAFMVICVAMVYFLIGKQS